MTNEPYVWLLDCSCNHCRDTRTDGIERLLEQSNALRARLRDPALVERVGDAVIDAITKAPLAGATKADLARAALAVIEEAMK